MSADPVVGPIPLAEAWREYDFVDAATGVNRVYRIVAPVSLTYRVVGTMHQVLDQNGVVHCVPAPGHFGCVLRWLAISVVQPDLEAVRGDGGQAAKVASPPETSSG